jgi:hypothetical protein
VHQQRARLLLPRHSYGQRVDWQWYLVLLASALHRQRRQAHTEGVMRLDKKQMDELKNRLESLDVAALESMRKAIEEVLFLKRITKSVKLSIKQGYATREDFIKKEDVK